VLASLPNDAERSAVVGTVAEKETAPSRLAKPKIATEPRLEWAD
jgi:hypothetical protein